MELISDLFCYVWQGTGNNCNTYVIRYHVRGRPRLAIVDPGQRVVPNPVFDARRQRVVGIHKEPALETLLASMRADGLEREDISLIVGTHAHTDHCEASKALKGMTAARIALHRADEPLYQGLVQIWRQEEDLPEEDLAPDIFLGEGDFKLGDDARVSLQVLHTPGHSPGSISLYWPDRKVLIAGDVIFYRGIGRTDTAGGDASQLRQSIERLARLEVEYLLTGHPYGHPGVLSGTDEVRRNFSYASGPGLTW